MLSNSMHTCTLLVIPIVLVMLLSHQCTHAASVHSSDDKPPKIMDLIHRRLSEGNPDQQQISKSMTLDAFYEKYLGAGSSVLLECSNTKSEILSSPALFPLSMQYSVNLEGHKPTNVKFHEVGGKWKLTFDADGKTWTLSELKEVKTWKAMKLVPECKATIGSSDSTEFLLGTVIDKQLVFQQDTSRPDIQPIIQTGATMTASELGLVSIVFQCERYPNIIRRSSISGFSTQLQSSMMTELGSPLVAVQSNIQFHEELGKWKMTFDVDKRFGKWTLIEINTWNYAGKCKATIGPSNSENYLLGTIDADKQLVFDGTTSQEIARRQRAQQKREAMQAPAAECPNTDGELQSSYATNPKHEIVFVFSQNANCRGVWPKEELVLVQDRNGGRPFWTSVRWGDKPYYKTRLHDSGYIQSIKLSMQSDGFTGFCCRSVTCSEINQKADPEAVCCQCYEEKAPSEERRARWNRMFAKENEETKAQHQV